MDYSKTNGIKSFINWNRLVFASKKEEARYIALNDIIKACKEPAKISDVLKVTAKYKYQYLGKILQTLVRLNYLSARYNDNGYAHKIYHAQVKSLTIEQCNDVMQLTCDYIARTKEPRKLKTIQQKRVDREKRKTTDQLIINGNGKTYTAEYLHKKRKENVQELKELGLYKLNKASYEINLQGSNNII